MTWWKMHEPEMTEAPWKKHSLLVTKPDRDILKNSWQQVVHSSRCNPAARLTLQGLTSISLVTQRAMTPVMSTRTNDPMATTSAGGTVVIRDVLALVDDTGSRDEFNALNEGLSVHLPGQNTWTGHHMIFIVTGDTDQDMAQHWIENWIETVDAGQPVGGTPLEWEVQSWVCAETAMVHLLLEAQQREREQEFMMQGGRAV